MFSKLKFPLVAALMFNSSVVLAESPELSPEDFISNTPAPSVEELTEEFDAALGFDMRMEEYPDNPEGSRRLFHTIFVENIVPEENYGFTGGGPFSYCSDSERAGPLLNNLLLALELTTNERIDKEYAESQIQEVIDFCFPDEMPNPDELSLTS